MIIERKCGLVEMTMLDIPVKFENEYKVDTEQVKGQVIKCDGVVVGKITTATEDYIYGFVYGPKCLNYLELGKQFTYEVEVERKPMSPLEKILDDNSKSMNLYYKAMDAIHKAKKEKEND